MVNGSFRNNIEKIAIIKNPPVVMMGYAIEIFSLFNANTYKITFVAKKNNPSNKRQFVMNL